MDLDRGDVVADAMLDAWRHLLAAHPDAWVSGRDGVQACATGIPSAGLNGVWCSRLDPDPAELERLLDELDQRQLPHVLQARPGVSGDAAEVAERRGLVADQDVPLMRLDDSRRIEAPGPTGLEIRALEPDEAELHALTAADGFGEKPEHFRRLIRPEVLRAEGARAYVGEVDGQVVTTALGVTRGDCVGVFNVGTPEAHRRRGYGAAITARVVADGLAAGASWAWLQSSSAGYRVYESLGFETVERWRCWIRT
jgi:predicted GNAT family acetyltransferase